VIRRVLDGGEGWESGGRDVRSMLRGERERLEERGVVGWDVGGEDSGWVWRERDGCEVDGKVMLTVCSGRNGCGVAGRWYKV
jgi:hypothetical protein